MSTLALRDRRAYKAAILAAFALVTVLAAGWAVSRGSLPISADQILRSVLLGEQGTYSRVIWDIRIPRALLACLVGMNLAVSGAILQAVMMNPLADPSIIGISSGAGLFGIFILVILPQYQSFVPVFAFFGAMLAAFIIYVLAWRNGIQPMRIILAGVAVSALFGAGISGTLVFFSDRVHGALTFMNGSLSARSWPEVQTLWPYSLAGLALAFLFTRRLNILVLGDDVARGLGLNVELTRIALTALAALLAASAVSVVGLLGFVGLIVPHTVRLLVGQSHGWLLVGSALAGAALLLLSDTVARTVFSPTEIPVGIIMAALGVPFFLFLLRR